MAGVVLPGAACSEKSGCVTALDGRISLLRKAVDAPGEARPDLAIFADLFTALSGKPAPSEATLRSQMAEQQRPFAPTGGSLLGATPALATPVPAELHLLVGKCPFHFGTMTTYSPANLELAPTGVIIINPADAARLGVAEGGQLKLTGPAGSASGKVMLKAKVPAGLLLAADHFADLNIQQIMPAGSNCVAVTAVKA
jgi:anaerobic selenocysteine-containing dehydrogenase